MGARHPYRVREIAQQAGLSEATVDRVLHERPGVRASTRAEVRQAIADLDRQSDQLRLAGQTFLVDLVMVAPRRFSDAVRTALEAELPNLRPALLRVRFHLVEESTPEQLAGVLARIAARGSQGVLLKAPDSPAVATAVDDLAAAGVPTVTLVTDVTGCRRVGYVGIDNRAAGSTAAYLISRTPGAAAPDRAGAGGVLMSLSSSTFRGEEERESGFRATMAELAPDRNLVEVTETDGLHASTLEAVGRALTEHPDVDTVYSIGGGNSGILEAFAAEGRAVTTFVAHDLDDDNRVLLRRRQLTAVLHHDLRSDLAAAARLILHARGALPGRPWSRTSQIQVITPFNVPQT